MRYDLPHAGPGQAIGLLGGSFDPPHAGHMHITREALKRFGLDRVWWLVSPGNPLKTKGPAPIDRRLEVARRMAAHPRVTVTDVETRIGTRYTAETLSTLQGLYPRVHFVWLMGADNLTQFHRWDNWEWIMQNVPVGVLARLGDRMPACTSPAARRFAAYRLPASEGRRLPYAACPAWCFANVPMLDISSTEIRARGDWT